MLFHETKLAGAFVIEPEPRRDDRGFFARTWCRDEFAARGLEVNFVQRNLSANPVCGTLRGMHWQAAPHGEVKVVRCTRGAIYDVIVDMRPESATYRQWIGVELDETNYRMLYIPRDFAHGFQTLTDNVEVSYLVSHPYTPSAGRGIRYDDPAVGISWPRPVSRISEQDRAWAPLQPADAPLESV